MFNNKQNNQPFGLNNFHFGNFRSDACKSSRAEAFINNIKNYYSQIDTLNIEGVLSRFSPKAKYKRNGWNPLKGIVQIRDFFC